MTALERTPSGSLDPAIASAKFLPPPLPRHWVRRDRLTCQLSASVQHRLTVVTGPPGAGKTVLLADWAHGAAGQVAWLTVEEVDNDPERFWPHVAAALDLDHTCGRVEIDNGIAPAGDPYLALLARYTSATTPRILIVDDFHLITDASIIAGVASLVEHLPPAELRLVVAGQRAPGFPLQRLQSAGEATTIGDHDLRFTVEESAALITLAAGVFIPLEEITTLAERNEGWAAGLYLAAVALSQHEDSSEFVRQYSGNFSPVAEYLELEMLLRQPPDLIRFLLQISVLDHLSPDLCRAVSGRADAGRILEQLSDHHLFVIRTGSEEGGFRFHRLLADLLRCRLRLEDPLLARQAHFSAATWFERRHDVRAAAHHFSQAHAYERACMLLFAGPGQPLEGGLPAETAILTSGSQSGTTREADPGHLYVLAAVQLGSLRVATAARLLRRLSATVAEDPERSLWQGRVEFLWAIHAERLADAPAVLDHCRTATELMGSCTQLATGAAPQALAGSWLETMDATICTRLPVLAARAHAWLGDFDDAEACLVDHLDDHRRAEAGHPAIFARIAGGRGRLKEAYRLATLAVEEMESSDGGNELVGLDARLVLADVLFEHNELEAAREQLDSALHLCQSTEVSHWIWAVEIDLARLLVAQQRPGEALSRIGHLRRIEGRTPPPHHLLQKLNRVEITCRLVLGDVEGCFLIGRSMAGGDMSAETFARLDLCAGRPDRALTRLAAGRIATTATEIRRLVLLACAELQLGRTRRAHDTLRRAVETGRGDLYVRPFLDDPAQTVLLLRGMVTTRPDPYLMHLISEAARLAPAAAPVVPTSAMLEPLTEREREVLGFLPSHLNQHQIAMVMYVSLNTVKSHLKAIYRKIGAASRDEAVTIARGHGLL
jgi:LuxR family maltose regulon positive regulatory protein